MSSWGGAGPGVLAAVRPALPLYGRPSTQQTSRGQVPNLFLSKLRAK